MVLQLYNDANQFMCQLDEIHRKLGFYSPEDGYGIHVRHHSFHPTHCAFRKDGVTKASVSLVADSGYGPSFALCRRVARGCLSGHEV